MRTSPNPIGEGNELSLDLWECDRTQCLKRSDLALVAVTAGSKIKQAMKPFFNLCVNLRPIRWQRIGEDSRVLKSLLFKVTLLIQDGVTKEHCIAIHLFTKQVLRLCKGSGMLFTALYLKQCSSSLQTFYGGIKRPHDLLPVPVSLTRSQAYHVSFLLFIEG